MQIKKYQGKSAIALKFISDEFSYSTPYRDIEEYFIKSIEVEKTIYNLEITVFGKKKI